MPVQTSMESFANPREAQTDGRQVIEKLERVSSLGRWRMRPESPVALHCSWDKSRNASYHVPQM